MISPVDLNPLNEHDVMTFLKNIISLFPEVKLVMNPHGIRFHYKTDFNLDRPYDSILSLAFQNYHGSSERKLWPATYELYRYEAIYAHPKKEMCIQAIKELSYGPYLCFITQDLEKWSVKIPRFSSLEELKLKLAIEGK